jgi:hypothetical protein
VRKKSPEWNRIVHSGYIPGGGGAAGPAPFPLPGIGQAVERHRCLPVGDPVPASPTYIPARGIVYNPVHLPGFSCLLLNLVHHSAGRRTSTCLRNPSGGVRSLPAVPAHPTGQIPIVKRGGTMFPGLMPGSGLPSVGCPLPSPPFPDDHLLGNHPASPSPRRLLYSQHGGREI